MDDRLQKLILETHDSTLVSGIQILELVKLCAKLEIHLAALNGHIDDHTKAIADIRESFGSRITRAETKLWILFGLGGIITTVITLLKVFGVI